MNIKTLVGIGLLSFATAFAQDYYEDNRDVSSSETSSESQQVSEPAQEQSAPQGESSAPVVQAPSIPAGSAPANFKVLHGTAYSAVPNVGLSNNINLLLMYPNLFYNKKFFYMEPANKMGVVSLGSWFTMLDVSQDVGRWTVGYGYRDFGASFKLGLGKFFHSNEDVGDSSSTKAGDDIGAIVTFGVAGLALTFNVDWLTYNTEVNTDPKNGPEKKQKARDLKIIATLTNAPKAENFTWNLGARIINHLNEEKTAGDFSGLVDAQNAPSFFQFAPMLKTALTVLQNERARVIVGGNAEIPVLSFYDPVDLLSISLVLSPNIVGEVMLADKFIWYGEAALDWTVLKFDSGKDASGDYTEKVLDMNKVVTTTGIRYQYSESFALEAALGDKFYTSTSAFFNGNDVFASFGAFIFF